MILQLTKTCAVQLHAVSGWSYDAAHDVTTFFLPAKQMLSAKGNWNTLITNAKAKGAIWTNGKTIKLRQ